MYKNRENLEGPRSPTAASMFKCKMAIMASHSTIMQQNFGNYMGRLLSRFSQMCLFCQSTRKVGFAAREIAKIAARCPIKQSGRS